MIRPTEPADPSMYASSSSHVRMRTGPQSTRIERMYGPSSSSGSWWRSPASTSAPTTGCGDPPPAKARRSSSSHASSAARRADGVGGRCGPSTIWSAVRTYPYSACVAGRTSAGRRRVAQ